MPPIDSSDLRDATVKLENSIDRLNESVERVAEMLASPAPAGPSAEQFARGVAVQTVTPIAADNPDDPENKRYARAAIDAMTRFILTGRG